MPNEMLPDSKSFSHVEGVRIALAELSHVPGIEETLKGLPPHLAGRWMWFSRLNVPAPLRRKGLATKLLNEMEAWADAVGAGIINCINPYGDMSFEDLAHLYEKHGFSWLGPNTKEVMLRLPKESK